MTTHRAFDQGRRDVLIGATVAAAAIALPAATGAAQPKQRESQMSSSIFTTKDGTQIFYKDWGTGQPIVFSHGWPLSADDWDAQMLFFLEHGFRVIAHDRRGHGRSTPDRDRQRDGHLRRRSRAARRASRSEATPSMSATRPAAAKSRATSARARQRARREGGADRRRAAAHAEDGQATPAACRSRSSTAFASAVANRAAVLHRHPDGPVLRLQPPGREGLGGHHPQLVAAGHDGRRQGALRLHQGLLARPTSPRT